MDQPLFPLSVLRKAKSRFALSVSISFAVASIMTTFACAARGDVLAWGYNGNYALGNGTTTSSNSPIQVSGLTQINAIASGLNHSAAILPNGSVWQWGNSGNWQEPIPAHVIGPPPVQSVACGTQFTLALDLNGVVWSWGQNNAGQLGDGTQISRTIPQAVAGLTNVVGIAASFGTHSLAVRADGTAWAWGANNTGQLGDGTTLDRSFPVQVAGLSGVVSAVGGTYHSVALRADGTVWAWGSTAWGLLGNGEPNAASPSPPVRVGQLTSIVCLSAGDRHTLAVDASGKVWAWGNNAFGQLGDGTTIDRDVPVEVIGLSNVVAVSSGNHHNLALTTNGSVWAWGENVDGQLGDGTQDNRLAPVLVNGLAPASAISAGGYHSLAVTRTNRSPTANAGADVTESCSDAVTLDGSGSSDPDGDALTYRWYEGNILVASVINPTITLSAGVHTLTLVVTDSSGESSFDTITVTVDAMGFEGFLPPIGGADATGGSFADPIRAFKLGSTIPVKFRAFGCGGDVLTGIHTLTVTKYSNAVDSDPPIDATPTDAATTGNQFRLTGNQWHFNLDTSFLSKGTWKLVATLADGSTHFVWITLK